MHAELDARLNRRLQQASGISLADYEVLVQLSEADDGRLRIFELQALLQWEKSRVSHHLTRMERRDLIGREECVTDGRGSFARITSMGTAALQGAAPGHVDDVRRYLVDVLTPSQLQALAQMSAAVLAALEADAGQTTGA